MMTNDLVLRPAGYLTPEQAQSRDEWDAYFMGLAHAVATKSKDRSTKVGAVIVGTDDQAILTTGWNGFPRRVSDNIMSRHDRPEKYFWTEHAERNAIYNAVRRGVPLMGSTIYTTLYPCCDCARAIVQSGIAHLVSIEPEWNDEHRRATTHFDVSRQIFTETGVSVRYVPTEIRLLRESTQLDGNR